MIYGIGSDIIDVLRIERAMRRKRFIQRVYTEREREYIERTGSSCQTAAGVFAAKEAVAKSLKTGFLGFAFTDVEIVHNFRGAPEVVLHGGAEQIARENSVCIIHISISHEKHTAVAMAVAEMKPSVQ